MRLPKQSRRRRVALLPRPHHLRTERAWPVAGVVPVPSHATTAGAGERRFVRVRPLPRSWSHAVLDVLGHRPQLSNQLSVLNRGLPDTRPTPNAEIGPGGMMPPIAPMSPGRYQWERDGCGMGPKDVPHRPEAPRWGHGGDGGIIRPLESRLSAPHRLPVGSTKASALLRVPFPAPTVGRNDRLPSSPARFSRISLGSVGDDRGDNDRPPAPVTLP